MSKAYISEELRRTVIEDFQARCAYCHSPELLLNGAYTMDHIVPEFAGGSTTRDNLCYACILCNGHKGTRQSALDPLTGKRVLLFHPRQQRWGRYFTWAVDGLIIEGKTQSGRATVATLQLNNLSLLRMRQQWQDLSAFALEWKRHLPTYKNTQQKDVQE